ncbi:hypothetical protein C5C31_14980, partial [Rathayibacter rathayi]|uniref:hypothetical protein n=1 Tax=Rathayibacter rathayi TaxID=33887 RepID=UPI000D406E11
MASKRRSPPRPRRAPRPLFSSGAPDLLAVGDSPVLRTPGGVTGVGDALTPAGALTFAGLEWMGHRAYDPTTRGFLSTDPL